MLKKVHEKFSCFFSGGQDSRPASLSQLSIWNCVTPGTLARIAILQLLAKHYRDSNPGSRAHMVGHEARPVLKLTPPLDASDRSVRTFNFIEANSKLPTWFSADETDALHKRISPSLHGQLRSVLVVVSDDMLKKKAAPKKKARSDGNSASTNQMSGSESSEFRTPEVSCVTRKRINNMLVSFFKRVVKES